MARDKVLGQLEKTMHPPIPEPIHPSKSVRLIDVECTSNGVCKVNVLWSTTFHQTHLPSYTVTWILSIQEWFVYVLFRIYRDTYTYMVILW